MAVMTVADIEGATAAHTVINTQIHGLVTPNSHGDTASTYIFDLGPNLVRFDGVDLNWDEASDIHDLPGFQGGTITSFQALADDGVTVLFAITGLSLPLETYLNGTTYADPTWDGGQRPAAGFETLFLGDDTISGSSFDDVLEGIAGDDTINGFGGTDTIWGGAGDDAIDGGDETDLIYGGTGVDILNGGSGDDGLIGHGTNESNNAGFNYAPSRDFLNGNEGNDQLFAQHAWSSGEAYSFAGGVVADGGAGQDVLFANFSHLAGDVVVDLRDPSVAATFSDGSSIVNVEQVHLVLGDGNDTIYDGSLSDIIYAGGGNDTIYHGGGDGNMTGGNPLIDAGAGDDAVHWANTPGNAVLTGGDGFDSLFIDWSAMGSGFYMGWLPQDFEAIEFTGGIGNDTVQSYPGTNQTLVAFGGGGNDSLFGSLLGDELDGGDGSDALEGEGGDDELKGGSGNDGLGGGDGDDHIEGGAGADTLYGDRDGGPDGFDTVSYAQSGAAVTVDLSVGQDPANPFAANQSGFGAGGDAEGDLFFSINRLVGSAFNDTLTGDWRDTTLAGGDGNDVLNGLDGDDFLAGGAGVDTLDGGAGSDTAFFIGGNGVTVSLLTGAVQWGHAQGDTLISIENLSGSAFFDELTGDAGANVLSGDGGNDFLNGSNGDDELFGGEGNDLMFGGAGADSFAGDLGVDTVNYSTSGEGVQIVLASVTLTNPSDPLDTREYVEGAYFGHAQGDAFTGIEIITGSAFEDLLIGDADANTFNGGNGDDFFLGSLGADRMNGNAGEDGVSYELSAAGVTVSLLFGTGGGVGSDADGDVLTGMEHVRGSAFDDRLTGNTGDNDLLGGDGNDEFNGSLGDDEIFGEAGDDVMVGGAGGDEFDGGAGIDWVYYANSNAAVNVSLTAGFGSGGHASGDFLDSFVSVENLYGSIFADTMNGDGGANTLNGFQGSDMLNGLAGDDLLLGGLGDDVVDGGAGDDVLSGYLGADTFVYNAAGFGQDIVIGFEDGADKFDLDGGLTFADFTESPAGPGTLLTLTVEPANTILILGVPPAQIDAADFV